MASRGAGVFQMGQHTLRYECFPSLTPADPRQSVQVSSLQPTRRIDRLALHGAIRSKVAKLMRDGSPGQQQGLILIKGGGPFHIHDTDTEGIFRQESYFHYLFGVTEEEFYGAINLDTDPPKSILFMPRLPEAYAVWMGKIDTPDDKKKQYAVDEVRYTDEIASYLKKLHPAVIHVLNGINTDSGQNSSPAIFDGIDDYRVDDKRLFPVLQHARAVKTPAELEVMRYATKIASAGHVRVMQEVRPGMMEYQLEANFLNYVYRNGGCRHAPYTPICASGSNGAVLHYGHAGAPNDCELEDGAMLLIDMGCEYYSYDSDITCSYPANGRFNDDQKVVYNAVLSAQRAVLQAMKPGVQWPDMHRLAERCILTGLKEGGLVTGDVDAAVDERIGALFMPHGLGHLLGIDTHDVGGYAGNTPPRIDEPGLRSLRTARSLEENMVITVEPGCYFNPALLHPAFDNPAQAKYLVKERLLPLLGFGGVRIEDDVIVTASGAESMTDVPRTVEDVEAVMAGASWPNK